MFKLRFILFKALVTPGREGERERGREGERDGGREGGRKRGREGDVSVNLYSLANIHLEVHVRVGNSCSLYILLIVYMYIYAISGAHEKNYKKNAE